MTYTGLFTTADIRARLDAGLPMDPDSDDWDWDNTLDNIINHNLVPDADESAVRAFLKYLDVSGRSKERFTPGEITEELRERYRGYWSDAAKFAREYAAPDWAEMSEHPRASAAALAEFTDVIDWAAYAERTEFTDRWALIRLDGESGVHAFRQD